MAIPWDKMWPEIEEEMERTCGEIQMSPTAYQEFVRVDEEWKAEIKRRKLASALEAGFSSFEEYEEAVLKKDSEREAKARKRVEKETGKSWEEFWAAHPQRQRTPPEPFPQCNCNDHPISMFCAKSLIDYRTQDALDLVGLFQAEGSQDIRDLQIEPHHKSKRLSPEILVQYWERDTQEASSEWPPWLKGDSVLRRIEQQNKHDSYQERVKRLQEANARHDTPSSIFTEDRSDFDATRPSTPTGASFSGENSMIKDCNESEIKEQETYSCNAPSGKPDNIQIVRQKPRPKHKTTNTDRSQLARASGISKNTPVAKRQRRKTIVETSKRTRSQNTTKF